MNTNKLYHYVYRITNITENKHYYGVRSCNILPKKDLGVKYFSSSTDKEFIKEQKTSPSNFKYKVIAVYDKRQSALNLEVRLHAKFDVGFNTHFYNKVKQTSNKFDNASVMTEEYLRNFSLKRKGKGNPMYGLHLSKEAKDKIRKANTGRVFSDDTRKKMSESAINKNISGRNNPRALPANIYDFATNKLVAENVIIKNWAKANGFSSSTLHDTAKANRSMPSSRRNPHQHKGIYAKYL